MLGRLRGYIFAACFGLLATHELDAVRCFEWRVLPITRWMPEPIAMTTFILAHIPLFAWLARVCWAGDAAKHHLARQLLCGFAVIHVGLHWLFRNDPNYFFQGWLSNGLIGGAGLAGALFLALAWQDKRHA
jgi:hypothetical protein